MNSPQQVQDAQREQQMREQRLMERRFANLADTVRAWAGEAPSAVQEAQWLALERALPGLRQAKDRSRSTSTWMYGGAGARQGFAHGQRLVTVAAVSACAVAALMVVRGWDRGGADQSEPQLSFVVSKSGATTPGVTSPTGAISSTGLPARVAFSDGSDVVLEPGARGTVVATTARGARMRLDEGRARFAVAHRPRADWSVEAGPFVVVVHGTVFDVEWSKQSGALAVGLIAGTITIKGPMAGGQVTLRSGQRLIARDATGVVGRQGMPGASSRNGSSATWQVNVSDNLGAPMEDGRPPLPGKDGAGAAEPPSAEAPADTVPAAATTKSGRHRGAGGPGGAAAKERIAALAATWESQVAGGAFQTVVAEADAAGVERCLAHAPVGSLGALADAARYVRRTDLARRALMAERRRFPGTVAAHDAAFLIGRLAEDASGDTREALLWYDRYLEEAERGTYSSEALGRKMLTLARLDQSADARSTADKYLETYPNGAFATRARRIRDDAKRDDAEKDR